MELLKRHWIVPRFKLLGIVEKIKKTNSSKKDRIEPKIQQGTAVVRNLISDTTQILVTHSTLLTSHHYDLCVLLLLKVHMLKLQLMVLWDERELEEWLGPEVRVFTNDARATVKEKAASLPLWYNAHNEKTSVYEEGSICQCCCIILTLAATAFTSKYNIFLSL